ncbi:MAG: hypothetical protein KC496_22645 [Anaerolineae bacterium]|nr:hypothetical protein [Anaerolineae bacterium]
MQPVEPLALALALVSVLYKVVAILKPFIQSISAKIKLSDEAYRAAVQVVAVLVGMALMLFEAGAIGAFETLLPAATPTWLIVVFGGVVLSFGAEAVNFVFSLRDYLGNYELVIEDGTAQTTPNDSGTATHSATG